MEKKNKMDKDKSLKLINLHKKSSNTIHKARNVLTKIDFEDRKYIIKSFKVPNYFNKVIYTFFKKSKARKSYENSLKIGDFSPLPFSYVENYKFGLIDDSYFISESFEYDFTIREPLLQNDFEDKENIFKAFAKFTYELHEKGIYHLDYSPGNILVKKEENEYIFKIVDINRMQFKTLTLDERLKNFSKLWAKDEDLKIIIKEYSFLINKDSNESQKIALNYSVKHKENTESKKKYKKILKGK